MTSCSTALLAAKRILQTALIASRFLQLFLQKSLTSKWGLSSKVEVWNITKNKVLKLVN